MTVSRNHSYRHRYTSKWCGSILHIFDPVFRQNYYYVDCKNESDYNKILKVEFKIIQDAKNRDGGFQVFERQKTEIGFIWTSGRDVPTLAHEVLHAVSYCLRSKGLQLSAETDEAYAYVMGFIMGEILKQWKVKK